MQEAKDMRARIESQRKDVKDRRSRTRVHGLEVGTKKGGHLHCIFYNTIIIII